MTKQEILYRCVERCLDMGYEFSIVHQDMSDPDDEEPNHILTLSVAGNAYSTNGMPDGGPCQYIDLKELVTDFVNLIGVLEADNE